MKLDRNCEIKVVVYRVKFHTYTLHVDWKDLPHVEGRSNATGES